MEILQAAILSLMLSLDALTAGFAYGCTGIKIPFRSVVVINLVCTALLGAALFAGSLASGIIPHFVGVLLCFWTLLIIGVVKLVQGLKPLDCDKSDKSDKSEVKTTILKSGEAAIIAAALSLDGVAAGFGAALGGVNIAVMLIVSLAAHMIAVPLGCEIGARISRKIRFNITWIGGVVIILLAFTKLL